MFSDLNELQDRTERTHAELLRKVDRYGKQLPARLLAAILSYVEEHEVGASQTVCKGWKLPSSLL